MSHFRKASATEQTVRLNGTRPFINNQVFISSGHSKLDSICGGGVPLGTLVLLESDRFGCFSTDFVRYFLAEGILTGQKCLLVYGDSLGMKDYATLPSLPLCLNKSNLQDNAISSEINQGESLKVAWQYRKYLLQSNNSKKLHPNSSTYCHSYDLSKSMQKEYLDLNMLVTLEYPIDLVKERLDLKEEKSLEDFYFQLFQQIKTKVENFLGISNCTCLNERRKIAWKTTVCRLVIPGIGSNLWEASTSLHQRLIYEFLRSLRCFIRDLPVVCVVPIKNNLLLPSLLKQIQHLCDISITLSSLVGSSHGFAEFIGLLEVNKLARINSLTCHMPSATKYGIKRDRRKLKLEKLHLPPEDNRIASASKNDCSVDF